ncbi:ABC1 kinase family protein [Thermohalobacter berrensis]|uniref:Ubiquinone biosynthesis protein UbiB n=1 Tax=Thermohalobacter berrensis TaxID=99594 RepID=A0A419TB19_9FIRM|nr:AarF/UbiB family protein [Thermohalobacter berrensis]RKD34652.1 ubiquinone biosynthesis protein UbiB [Thermohalobacter berrensis]
MKINRIERSYKNLKRYREIAKVLTKYGFSFLTEKVDKSFPFNRYFFKASKELYKNYSRAERIRLAFEELGPTFIKLGQILSTRYDILPKDIVEELSQLQDRVKEFDYEIAKEIIENELETEIENIFEHFNKIPIASASIGQVYKANLKNGDKVVVKIQRPNIQKIINTDIDILYFIAHMLDEHFSKRSPVKAVEIVKEFSYFIKKELDYTYEAQNCDSFRENFKNDNRVYIPKIYWEYTTKRVLVMEEIKGVKVSNIKEIEKLGWDKEKIARLGAKIFMEQVFIHGLFHGDPHPGNVLVINENKVGFIDFGIVGYIDKKTLDLIISLLRAGINRDIERIIYKLSRMEVITDKTDKMGLEKDLYYLVNYYYNVPLKKLSLGNAFNELLQIAYKHKLKMPSQLALLLKTIIIVEGTGKKLNPKFNLTNISNEVLKNMQLNRLKPKNLLKGITNISTSYYDDIKFIPKQIISILSKLEKDKIKLYVQLKGLKDLEDEINNMTNRISLSLLVSSIIIGSSLVIQANIGPKLLGMSAFGLIGYATSGVLGLFLIISILLKK